MLYNFDGMCYDKVNYKEEKELNFAEGEHMQKYKILITDDSEMNRSILADMLGNEYEILEAENGLQALELIRTYQHDISLVLLDIVMPELDGFGVLDEMNRYGWITDIPVIMISTESGASYVERAYELGVTDFISRPFDALIVHRRVVNTILLYSKQKKLIDLAAQQIYEKERQSRLMIEILSHIVEFRNGESGQHVRRVRLLTELLLRYLNEHSDVYRFSRQEIATVSIASALHDVGKIAISEELLNKPGKLTEAEFEVMKTHSLIGAQMLDDLDVHQNDPLIRTAYEICRWHHERYDGGGYPDGLCGDEIPVSAQIVALADVYDALTSNRVYKKAIPHEKAVSMILEGQCGAFNPILLSCLDELSDILEEHLKNGISTADPLGMRGAVKEMLQREELTASQRTLQLLERERMKYEFFAALTKEIQFEYTVSPSMVKLSPFGAGILRCPETIMNPRRDEKVLAVLPEPEINALESALRSATPEKPEITYDCKLNLEDGERWFSIVSRTLWSEEEPSRCIGVIGKAVDIHDSRMKTDALEKKASTDPLTGLLNHASAKKQIQEYLTQHPSRKFALVVFDLDKFKSANDTFGHQFGDQILIQTVQWLRSSTRREDIIARVGGDEFILFFEYKTDPESIICRIFSSLCGDCGDFTVSVSFGIALTETIGFNYDALFRAADQALYAVKRSGGGQYRFFDATMQDMFSVISPIDEADGKYSDKSEEKI